MLLFTTTVFAQTKTENLLFEGAGIRGLAYSGALKILEQKGIVQNIKRVGGTSAGAITALLLSLGYSAAEIEQLISTTSFKKWNDGRWSIIGGALRTRNYFGWYRGRKATAALGKIIAQKTGNANITFAQLQAKGFKDLYVTATCLNKQSLIIFSAEHYPHMQVKNAVRISMGIPLYFEAVFIDSVGTVVQHPKNKVGLDVVVDGGFVLNYPIKLFDSTKYFKAGANTFEVNPHSLGFRIDPPLQAAQNNIDRGLPNLPVENFKQYLAALYNISIEGLSRPLLTEQDWQRTVSISDGSIGPRIRRLKKSAVQTLVQNGAVATQNYFTEHRTFK